MLKHRMPLLAPPATALSSLSIVPDNGASLSPKIILTTQHMQHLSDAATHLKDIDWQNPNLAPPTRREAGRLLNNCTLQDASFGIAMHHAQQQYARDGYTVLHFPQTTQTEPDQLHKELVMVLTAFGTQFGAFKQRGLWQTLGVNPQAQELRAESTGTIPLHIDFDQSTCPPDGVALFCVRPDPCGGGQNTLFNYEGFLKKLPPQSLHRLAQISYSYSHLYEQNGIGEIYNPHPLIDIRNDVPVLLRYNGKALTSLEGDTHDLFAGLEELFMESAVTVALNTGDCLIMDQTKTLHGRRPLGARDAHDIPPQKDRLLWQTYLRHD